MAGIVQVVIVHLMLKAVPMVNLIVAMANVFMVHGHVTVMVTVQMVLMKMIEEQDLHTVMKILIMMKLIVLHKLVKIKVCGIVAMANVFLHLMYVMDQVNSVTQAGVLTVQMAQMKV